MASMHRVTRAWYIIQAKGYLKTKLAQSIHNPGHYCMDVKMSKGNVIPSLNGSQLYSSHPKQKCTKIYPEETAPGPRPLPYMGKILTFDRKVVETPFFLPN